MSSQNERCCDYFALRYYSREDAEDSVKYVSGTILDDRSVRVDFDWGFEEGRQWGRGRSGGQVIIYFKSLLFFFFVDCFLSLQKNICFC